MGNDGDQPQHPQAFKNISDGGLRATTKKRFGARGTALESQRADRALHSEIFMAGDNTSIA